LNDEQHNTARSYKENHYFNPLKANFQSPTKLNTRVLKYQSIMNLDMFLHVITT